MKPAPPKLPSLPSLFWRDIFIGRCIKTLVAGVLIAIGFQWATLPTPPGQEPTFEAMMGPWASLAGVVLAVAVVPFLIWRYLRVRKILSQGQIVKAKVEDLDTRTFEVNSEDRSLSHKRSYRHSYYATLSYTVGGTARTARFQLPNSAFVYDLKKGGETDQSVLDSTPDKPLIRIVYLGRF